MLGEGGKNQDSIDMFGPFDYFVFNSVLKKFKICQEVVRVVVVITIAHIFFYFQMKGELWCLTPILVLSSSAAKQI
jgi:hypothetical protein